MQLKLIWKVTDSIHELMGTTSGIIHKTTQANVCKVFKSMDINQDRKVSLDEFIKYCTTHKDARQSLKVNLF